LIITWPFVELPPGVCQPLKEAEVENNPLPATWIFSPGTTVPMPTLPLPNIAILADSVWRVMPLARVVPVLNKIVEAPAPVPAPALSVKVPPPKSLKVVPATVFPPATVIANPATSVKLSLGLITPCLSVKFI